jgi:hypothetical protein
MSADHFSFDDKYNVVWQLEGLFDNQYTNEKREQLFMYACTVFNSTIDDEYNNNKYPSDQTPLSVFDKFEILFQEIQPALRNALLNRYYLEKEKSLCNSQSNSEAILEDDDAETISALCDNEIKFYEVVLLLFGIFLPKYTPRGINLEYLNLLKWHLSDIRTEAIQHTISLSNYTDPFTNKQYPMITFPDN